MRGPYEPQHAKKLSRNKAGKHWRHFLGKRRHQRPNLSMVATHHNLWYKRTPKSISRDTIADQRGDNINHTRKKIAATNRWQNTDDEFHGNQRQEQPNHTMSAAHHNLWYKRIPISIGLGLEEGATEERIPPLEGETCWITDWEYWG